MGKIILVSGGTSSGKSSFAEEYCTRLNGKTAYIATSIIFDKEMEIKKYKHVKRREYKRWSTIEEHVNLCGVFEKEDFDYETVMIDCVTMYITNLIFDNDMEFDAKDIDIKEKKREKVKYNIEKMLNYISNSDVNFILVTNEIGMGVLPGNELSRFFAELSGEVNQMISSIADEVYFTVSGIPIKIK